MSGWGVLLNDVYIDGGLTWAEIQSAAPCTGVEPETIGCLTQPPEGLGLPSLRTEDVTYPQRDGVRHFKDWYEPRILTFDVVVGPDDACVGCSPREVVQRLMQAWSRQCDDTELVLFTDCHGQGVTVRGPLGPSTVQATNLWTNPSFESSSVDPWTSNAGSTTPTTSTAQAWTGARSMLVSRDTGTSVLYADATFNSMLPGAGTYTITLHGYYPTQDPLFGIRVSGTGITLADINTTTVNEWVSLTHTFTWDGVGSAILYIRGNDAIDPEARAYIDGIILTQGSTVEPYFDGDTPDTDDGTTVTTYAWTGTPHASTSTRSTATYTTFKETNRVANGPYGILGRPRQALLTWDRSNRRVARLTLRFDAVDQKLYVLDDCGTPGGGEKCVVLTPTITGDFLCYPICYDPVECYDVEGGQSGNEAIADVDGTECSCATITLTGTLTNPRVTNATTGDSIQYNGTISKGAVIIIDGTDGTATEEPGGASRTHLLSGSTSFCLQPGENRIVLTSTGQGDTGTAEVCFRDQIVSA